MKLEGHWSWDARIIGMAEKPEQDHHLTVIEGETISRAMFAFPVLEAMQSADPDNPIWRRMQQDRRYFPWRELPVLAATRIVLDLRISA